MKKKFKVFEFLCNRIDCNDNEIFQLGINRENA